MDEGTTVSKAARYAAFLSYSHKDAAQARWLHRRLETYRIPGRLVGTPGEHGPVPARLTPIFRDREEFPAAGDLSERIRSALGASDHLIILCSPNSAGSPWVAKEIAAWRELRPDRPVYAAILEGEPGQCFPCGLSEGGIEPLAADLRPHRDGRRLGLLKLVAGLSGVGLDALVQRDAARRVRRVTAITAAALVAVVAMAVMTTLALQARREAERQHAQAEGLIEFMLTNLRERLRGVGRLDIMTTTNRRALDYYRAQDMKSLPPASMERRARILHAMGEDDEKRGNLEQALLQFREAARSTASLLAAAPDDPDRIFAHAQSEFWIGTVDLERGDLAAARGAFGRYRELARRLLVANPHKVEWLREAGYAEGNLCTVELSEPIQPAAALASCKAALGWMEEAARRAQQPSMLAGDLANRHAWLADAWFRNGRADLSLHHRLAQERILGELIARDPLNMDVRDLWVTNQKALGGLEALGGDLPAGRARLRRALAVVEGLVRLDPENRQWRQRREDVSRKLSMLGVPAKAGDKR